MASLLYTGVVNKVVSRPWGQCVAVYLRGVGSHPSSRGRDGWKQCRAETCINHKFSITSSGQHNMIPLFLILLPKHGNQRRRQQGSQYKDCAQRRSSACITGFRVTCVEHQHGQTIVCHVATSLSKKALHVR